MRPGDTARLYHRLTSLAYVPEGQWPTPARPAPAEHPVVLRDFVPLDLERLPAACKSYAISLPVVELPRVWPRVGISATAVLAGRATVPRRARIDMATLARMLHLSAGVVRVSDRVGHRWLFRAAGSAGGRFPLEVYVSARNVEGLPNGVHWYDPVRHALVQIGPAANGEATSLIVTGVPWRTGWKYAERGLRHIYWDGGTMLAQLLALASSAGLDPRVWSRFPDAELDRLVGADTVHEFAIALVALGESEPAIRPSGEAARGDVAAAPVEFPLVTLTQHAGDLDRLGDPWPQGQHMPGEPPPSDDLDTVILRRGSARRLDPAASLDREMVDWMLASSLGATRIPHYIAVHAVEQLEPGLYRWPDLEQPVRRGLLRDELFRVCWDQDLGHDASFVVIAATDLDALDDRGYRDAQMEAGLVEGRLHLAAYALGLGASGMTFLDAELEGLLGEALAGLLLTCVGIPAYRHKPGGPPGAPTRVVLPTPREKPRSSNT